MIAKTLKAFAVVGEGYGDTPDQLEVAATDGVQLAVFATLPAATENLELNGEEVCEVLIVPAADFNRVTAERDALQQRLNAADQRIDELERDKYRLDAIEANFWEVRHHSSALADTGDYTSSIEIIGHWMDKPTERVIGEDYSENLRAAIDQAMAAPAYPPARPEYPELDAALDIPQ